MWETSKSLESDLLEGACSGRAVDGTNERISLCLRARVCVSDERTSQRGHLWPSLCSSFQWLWWQNVSVFKRGDRRGACADMFKSETVSHCLHGHANQHAQQGVSRPSGSDERGTAGLQRTSSESGTPHPQDQTVKRQLLTRALVCVRVFYAGVQAWRVMLGVILLPVETNLSLIFLRTCEESVVWDEIDLKSWQEFDYCVDTKRNWKTASVSLLRKYLRGQIEKIVRIKQSSWISFTAGGALVIRVFVKYAAAFSGMVVGRGDVWEWSCKRRNGLLICVMICKDEKIIFAPCHNYSF